VGSSHQIRGSAEKRTLTPYLQGHADGRKGRPFRYEKLPKHVKKRRAGFPPNARVYYTLYASGYHAGKYPLKNSWLYDACRKPIVIKTMLTVVGGFIGVGIASIAMRGVG